MVIKKALLIGINYKNTISELKGCINDIKKIRQLLIEEYDFKKEYILIMTDDYKIKPTRKNIIRGFKWLNSRNKANEFKEKYRILNGKANLVFCFSGHGGQVKDINGDELDGYDETICPLDYLKNGMITDDFIRTKFINKINSKTKLTGIVDACHSGTVFDLKWTIKPKSNNGFTIEKNDYYGKTKGNVILISGCKDDQISIDLKTNGALTHSLLKILKEFDYYISYEKLITEVNKYIHNNKLSDQLPCLSFGRHIKFHNRFEF